MKKCDHKLFDKNEGKKPSRRKLQELHPEEDFFFRADPENPTIVYLLHFHRPYHHARHYVGSCRKDLFTFRMLQHESGGNGSKLMKAVRKAGISWSISQVWEANRDFEQWIKNHIKHTSRLCPLCHGKISVGDGNQLNDNSIPFEGGAALC